MKAKANSWTRQPFVMGISVPYRASFTSAQFERLRAGLVPGGTTVDRWFMYYEEPFLFLHRSLTGKPVFRVKLRVSTEGAVVEEALLAEGQNQLGFDLGYQAQLLDFIISTLLLAQLKPFPRAQRLPIEFLEPWVALEANAEFFQHQLLAEIGSGHPLLRPSSNRLRNGSSAA